MKDIGITIAIVASCTGVAFLLFGWSPDNGTGNIALVYTVGLIYTTMHTTGYRYGIVVAFCSVICINYFFSVPYFEPNFTMSGYPVTFLVMLMIFTITSTITTRLKAQTQLLVEWEKQLMDAEKEKMRANLLRAISHDLRTPLTGIIGASTSYLENEANLSVEERRVLVMHMREDSDWLLHMVENLLSVTRINEQTASVVKCLESVEEVVSEAGIKIKKRLPEADIKINVPEEPLMVMMDAILIEQVLINLLENAVVHAQSRKPIELMVKVQENQVVFHVIDYGTGIEPEKIPAIFDGNSYSLPGGGDCNKGMGIGLSICKTIVLAHGGLINVCNQEEGADFFFSLPLED